jgi:hypothetical protein
MLHFAHEFSQLLKDLGTLEQIGVKTASAEATVLAEQGVIKGANDLYSILTKTASWEYPEVTEHYAQVDTLVCKVAGLLGKPLPESSLRAKIASTVVVDDLLTGFINSEKPGAQLKLAETRSFGREFLMSLLRKVL